MLPRKPSGGPEANGPRVAANLEPLPGHTDQEVIDHLIALLGLKTSSHVTPCALTIAIKTRQTSRDVSCRRATSLLTSATRHKCISVLWT